jgi:hypothetical protein
MEYILEIASGYPKFFALISYYHPFSYLREDNSVTFYFSNFEPAKFTLRDIEASEAYLRSGPFNHQSNNKPPISLEELIEYLEKNVRE